MADTSVPLTHLTRRAKLGAMAPSRKLQDASDPALVTADALNCPCVIADWAEYSQTRTARSGHAGYPLGSCSAIVNLSSHPS